MIVGFLTRVHDYPHTGEAEIITDLDISNTDGWSTLSLKMVTLSGVDSWHLPVFAAAVLQK